MNPHPTLLVLLLGGGMVLASPRLQLKLEAVMVLQRASSQLARVAQQLHGTCHKVQLPSTCTCHM
jgi:hypothetical protein